MGLGIAVDAIDISKYNQILEDMLRMIIEDVNDRELEFRKKHEISEAFSMLQVKYNIKDITEKIAINWLSKSRLLIEKTDREIAKQALGLKDTDEYTKR